MPNTKIIIEPTNKANQPIQKLTTNIKIMATKQKIENKNLTNFLLINSKDNTRGNNAPTNTDKLLIVPTVLKDVL